MPAGSDVSTPEPPADAEGSSDRRVDEVMAWLEAHGLLSDDRFAESRIHARAGRYGDLRIRQELKQHGIALGAEAARSLRESEAGRAWTVWKRRFGTAPADLSDRARQARFLGARGFSPDAVSRVLKRAAAADRGQEPAEAEDD